MHVSRQVLGDSSIYSFGRYFNLDYGSIDMYDSLLFRLLPDLPVYRTYKVKTLERRPELITFQIYGTLDLYAIFMAYNGIISHDEIRTGTILNCFNKRDLDDLISRMENIGSGSGGQYLSITGKNMTTKAERYFK